MGWAHLVAPREEREVLADDLGDGPVRDEEEAEDEPCKPDVPPSKPLATDEGHVDKRRAGVEDGEHGAHKHVGRARRDLHPDDTRNEQEVVRRGDLCQEAHLLRDEGHDGANVGAGGDLREHRLHQVRAVEDVCEQRVVVVVVKMQVR